jgi:hypothetical protein
MTINVKSFREVLKALHEHDVEYILVGGLAVILHDVPRVTEDIDIMDRVDEMFKYDDLEYQIIESEGIPIKVATIPTLIKLKEGTLRNIDRADVIMLMEKLKGKK